MKKTLLILMVAIVTGSISYAQTSKRDKRIERRFEKAEQRTENNDGVASLATKKSFVQDFPNAKAPYYFKGTFDEVSFLNGKDTCIAYYDDGDLISVLIGKSLGDLPPKARAAIADKYKGYVVKNVFFYDDDESNHTAMKLYEKNIPDNDAYYVELVNNNKYVVLRVSLSGEVVEFKK